MRRRRFLFGALASLSAPILTHECAAESQPDSHYPGKRTEHHDGERLGGFTFAERRELYHRDLFTGWLPFVEKYVIDPEYGGFLCNTDYNGSRVNTDKVPLFEGRGIWVYSYLYSHFGKNPQHLE